MKKDFMYSVPLNNSDRKDNETSIYRHPDFVNKDFKESIEFNTIHDMFKKRLENINSKFIGVRLKDKDGQISKSFTWYTTKQIFERSEAFGSGIIKMNLVESIKEWKDKEFKFLGVYAKNNLEYFIMDIGSCMQNVTVVPIYDTLGEEATQFAFKQTKMKSCVVTANHVLNILKNKKDNNQYETLENLIVMDPENLDQNAIDQYKNIINIVTFSEVEQAGAQEKLQWAQVTPEDIYAFSYTSGTTGEPKGAMLSHANICSTVSSAQCKIHLKSSDVHLSYLPMAHIFERISFMTFMSYNMRIGIFQGDVQKVKEDLAILKPTVFVSVPRLYNKMYDAIQKGIKQKSGFIQSIANKGIKTKLENLRKNGDYNHFFYDALIFNKMKKALGGKVRIAITGSAPISTDVIDFLKIAFQCPILEGYGQTEAIGMEFATETFDGISGHVGGPFSQNEFKLVDVPEMKYTNKDIDENGNPRPRGEIWVRGTNVFQGYYKLDEKNKETITEDGWLQSGDIGQLLYPLNRLQIIDRKKNIFKLSQGEYIAPEKLEDAYKNAHHLINEIYVYGDSLKSVLVAIVQVDKENIEALGKDYGVQGNDLSNNEELKQKIIAEFDKINKQNKFNSLEKIRKIYIETDSWQNLDLITTSFKKKRFDLKEHYQKVIDDMYKDLQ